MISVIITTYNRENLLPRALESVLMQTYKNYEIVIIDDGSTDNTKEVLKSFNDKRINYFYIENSGAGNAKNYGVKMSNGEFIVLLDSDDELSKKSILEEIKEEIGKGFDVISYSEIEKKFSPDKFIIEKQEKVNEISKYMNQYPLNYPGKPPYAIKKELYLKCDGMDIRQKWGDGISFWRKLFNETSNFCMIENVGYIYHLEGEDNISKGGKDKKIKLENIYKSIYSAYLENKFFFKEKDKINWLIVLFLIALKKRDKNKIKKCLIKLKSYNFISLLKSFNYILIKRVSR